MSLFYFYMLFAELQLSFSSEIARLAGTKGLNICRLIFPMHKNEVQQSCSNNKFFLKSTPEMASFAWALYSQVFLEVCFSQRRRVSSKVRAPQEP